MVVTDVDGTLVDLRLRIPDRVRDAAKAAQRRGVRVLLATGRIWPSTRPFCEALGADPPVILYNGGRVYDFAAGRVLWRRDVPAADARTVLRVLRDFPMLAPHVFVDDEVYVGRMSPLSEEYLRKDRLRAVETGDLYGYVDALLSQKQDAAVGKILTVGARPDLEDFAARLRAAAPQINHVFSEPAYLEVIPPGISKGHALRFVAETLGVPLSETIAVGDNFNDLEMIEAAGLGVAMGHAPEEVRRRADFVCPSIDDEGLREVIERFVLDAPAPGARSH